MRNITTITAVFKMLINTSINSCLFLLKWITKNPDTQAIMNLLFLVDFKFLIVEFWSIGSVITFSDPKFEDDFCSIGVGDFSCKNSSQMCQSSKWPLHPVRKFVKIFFKSSPTVYQIKVIFSRKHISTLFVLRG